MKKTGGIFHDRFIVLDYGTADERVFLCGASSKDAGARITSIVEDYGTAKYNSVIAENAGTTLEIQAQMEKEIPVPEPEFCVLLGNLLENAVDACRENDESGAIKVHIRQTGTSLIAITVDNPCRKPPVLEGKRFLSTKHSGPGIGTQSIRLIAERHRGDARFEWKNGMFYASVILIPSAES